MRLTFWQQFSSNHSAAFSIVAKFESEEVAQKVAAQVTEMLLETYRWKEYGLEDWDTNPSQIIHKFEQKLAFGTSWMISEGHIRRALQVFGNIIFVSDAPGYSNFDGSDEAFSTLFEKLGGEVILAGETSSDDVSMNLIGDALDEQLAEGILSHIIETKSYSGQNEYHHDFETENGYHSPAKAIRREGKRLFFEDIYYSPYHFDSLKSWYAFAKAYQMQNIQIQLHAGRSAKSLEISLNEIKHNQLMWERFENWSDTVELPQFAVAEFESREIAEKVATHLREILRNIQAWSKQNPVESQWVWEAFWERLAPLEKSMRELYSIEWDMSAIEWIHHYKRLADAILVQLDKRIFLANQQNSWIGVSPFDTIVEKLGALKVQRFVRTLPHFDFEISVANSMDLQGLWWMIEGAISERDYLWLPFYRDYNHPEQWQDNLKFIRLQDEAAKNYVDSLQEFEDLHSDLKIEYRLTEFLQKVYTIPDLFDADTLRLKAMTRDCDFSYAAYVIEGNRLKIERVIFTKAATLLGLEAFVLWLQSRGCEITINTH